MSYKPWSVALACLVIFALTGLAGFGVIVGVPVLLLVAAALAAPALLLRHSP